MLRVPLCLPPVPRVVCSGARPGLGLALWRQLPYSVLCYQPERGVPFCGWFETEPKNTSPRVASPVGLSGSHICLWLGSWSQGPGTKSCSAGGPLLPLLLPSECALTLSDE